MAEIYAVLTGDLVKSSELSAEELDEVRSSFLSAADEARKWKRGLIKGKPEFFRGDAWQMVVADPAWALRVGLFLRATTIGFHKVDTRLVIAMGTVEKINTRRISLSTGEAFKRSGEGLDGLGKKTHMAILLPPESGFFAGWMNVVAKLTDSLVKSWTKRQAEIVRLALLPEGLTQQEIAERVELYRDG